MPPAANTLVPQMQSVPPLPRLSDRQPISQFPYSDPSWNQSNQSSRKMSNFEDIAEHDALMLETKQQASSAQSAKLSGGKQKAVRKKAATSTPPQQTVTTVLPKIQDVFNISKRK